MKLLKFFTKCCSQCKQQTRLLEGFDMIEVVEVDCDQNEDLVEKYGVKSVPMTIIIDDNGVDKFRSVGITPVDRIKEFLNSCSNETN
jgi:thioredoxin 1